MDPANDAASVFYVACLAAVLLSATALCCILVTRNLIRVLLGIELITKAATLLLLASGYTAQRASTAEALIITLIVIEVVVIAVAAGIIIGTFRHSDTLSVAEVSKLKG